MSATILTFDRNRRSANRPTPSVTVNLALVVPLGLLELVENLEIVADIQPKLMQKIRTMTQDAIAEHADRVDPVTRPASLVRPSRRAR